MSAFICSDDHLCALAAYAKQKQIYGFEMRPMPGVSIEQEIVARLFAENAASVGCRYHEKPATYFDAPKFRRNPAWDFSPAAIIKSARCYRYQACEHEGWADSWAASLVERIIFAAIEDLPGYESAAWGAPIQSGSVSS